MKKILVLILTILMSNFLAISQKREAFEKIKKMEDELVYLFKVVAFNKKDSERKQANTEILKKLEIALNHVYSFDYQFDKIRQISKLTSDDLMLRVFTWHIQFSDSHFEYFGFLQFYPLANSDKYYVYKLTDYSEQITSADEFAGNHENWFGALYYEIVANQHDKKTYYTLLGWDGNDDFTNKKVVETLYFDSENKPFFGAEIFEIDKKQRTRIIFEFSMQVSMSLRYESRKKMIVFDHLAPSKPEFAGQFEYYGPDATQDAIYFEDGKWKYKSLIDIRNEK